MSGRVLVVDDSAVARLALARALRAAGLEVDERDSVATALTAVATVDVGGTPWHACALLDLELPDGNGLAVADALRAVASSFPVAFFTSGAAPEVLVRARTLGPIFGKPEELAAATAWASAAARR